MYCMGALDKVRATRHHPCMSPPVRLRRSHMLQHLSPEQIEALDRVREGMHLEMQSRLHADDYDGRSASSDRAEEAQPGS